MGSLALVRMRALLLMKDTAVLATAGPDGAPHTSLMAYLALETEPDTLYLLTPPSRKLENMRSNPRVSLLIDTREDAARDETSLPQAQRVQALTVTGEAEVVENGQEAGLLREALLARHPRLTSLAEAGETLVVRVKALRYQLLSGASRMEIADV